MWNPDASKKMGVFLERIWPPRDTPDGWVSHIGGRPNLPDGWEWPRIAFPDGDEFEGVTASLDFLAQIRLEDLPDVPDRELLPQEGVLFFFALALTAEPLDTFGPDAWRVLYYRGDVSSFPFRAPPSDAGWFLDDVDYTRTEAAEYRDPGASDKGLFPYCPVRAVAAPSWKRPDGIPYGDDVREWLRLVEAWPGEHRTPTTFEYAESDLPLRVEDALLNLFHARNQWREGVLSFDDLFARRYDLMSVSAEDRERVRMEYGDWLTRVKRTCAELVARGRSALLKDDERRLVRGLVAENSDRMKALGCHIWPNLRLAATLSMATLLLDSPELAASFSNEVDAAHPGNNFSPGGSGHRMLGHSHVIQEDIESDSVLLLQLGSDGSGPRFMWWDMGNLTFTISRDSLAALRFDRAIAKIEGH
ncbi:DUF1963 domain-containing protein [Methylosinus sp. sav-2]|jgi:hypothetical protein|uniref:DUF1963 domain-containing protein n=1 Tax=Methylosinus sp. sav-2 TaxID=2485168 RepID=UPI000A054F31|nr:DUF1963 domain-containing protein [Methylosinus sp. sav-2]